MLAAIFLTEEIHFSSSQGPHLSLHRQKLVAVFYVTQVFNKGEKGKVAFMA
jgi:hypothetical protein